MVDQSEVAFVVGGMKENGKPATSHRRPVIFKCKSGRSADDQAVLGGLRLFRSCRRAAAREMYSFKRKTDENAEITAGSTR